MFLPVRNSIKIPILLGLFLGTGFCTGCRTLKSEETSVGEIHRGMSWEGIPKRVDEDAYFQPLVDRNVNWIVQTPFGWQKRYDEPEIVLRTQGSYWGETDEGLRLTAKAARKHGIKTLLKPHIWLSKRLNGDKWRSDIAMKSEAEWRTWFENYSRFMLHYARLAQREGMEGLCIGTELHQTVFRVEEWNRLIGEIKAVYDGQLTYAGNWYREFEDVPFWDQLDFIGIQAYFPLATSANASVEQLKEGWQPHLQKMEALHRKTGKPIVFTEIGYKNTPDNAVEPWVWPKRNYEKQADGSYRVLPNPEDVIDNQAQADSFRAAFSVCWNQPWFKGMYIWKWYPSKMSGPRSRAERVEFSPQFRPAMAVIEAFYAQ